MTKNPNIHPEIRKFWEDQGYQVSQTTTEDIDACRYFDAVSSQGWWLHVATVFLSGNPTDYIFESNEYSEEEMLKIVKMKAFL